MGIWDFFTPDAGQKRRQWLNQNMNAPIDEALRYYLGAGNSMPQIAGLLAEGSPVASIDRAGTSFQDIYAPDRTGWQRAEAVGNTLTDMTGAGLGLLGAPAASKVGADLLTDVATRVSKNAKKAGDFAATDMVGTARAIGSGDMDFLTGWGSPQNARAAGADVVRQPFDMGRGSIDQVDDVLPLVPYEMRGQDIADRLADTPSALEVAGKEFGPAGSGFSALKGQRNTLLPSHYSRGFQTGETVAPNQSNWSKLHGSTLFSSVGDPTARKIVAQFGDEVLDNPVISQAGAQFSDINDFGWASARGAMSSKYNEAAKVENPYMMFLNMGEQSGDFAKHTGKLVGEVFKTAKISSNAIPAIDDSIRGIGMSIKVPVFGKDGKQLKNAKGDLVTKSETIRPFTNFKSISDPEYMGQYIADLPSGTERAAFIKGLDKAALQKMGVPNMGQVRLALANEDLIGRDWLSAGYRGFKPDMETGLLPTTPDMHETYDTMIKRIGNADTFDAGGGGVPANLVFADLSEVMRAKGTGGKLVPTSADYKVYESSPKRAKQLMDDRSIEMISNFTEIEGRFGRRAALQYAQELLSGGRITKEMIDAARKNNAPAWMLAALAPASGLLASQMGEPKNRGLLY